MVASPTRPITKELNVLVIEDRLAYSKTVFHAVRSARHPHDPEAVARAVDLVGHGEFLDDPGMVTRRAIDVVLLDAFETDRQREDPTAPLYAAIEVMEVIDGLRNPPSVVLYSQLIDEPSVHLPAREFPSVRAMFRPDVLLYEMGSALWDKQPAKALGPPAEDEYTTLGVGPGASIRKAIQAAKERDDVWELIVYGPSSNATHPRTRDYINSHVRTHLDLPAPGYRAVVEILQRILGFPVNTNTLR